MRINRKIIISIFVIFLFLMLPVSVQAVNEKKENSITTGLIAADLKVRTLDGEWKDSISSVKTGTVVEFKATVTIPRDCIWLGVKVYLPSISGSPMFTYLDGTISPEIDDENVGDSYAYDEEVAWNWLDAESSFNQIMTFRATVKKSGTQNVDLKVRVLYADNGELGAGSDSLRFNSGPGKSRSIYITLREKILQILPIIEKIQIKLNKLYHNCN